MEVWKNLGLSSYNYVTILWSRIRWKKIVSITKQSQNPKTPTFSIPSNTIQFSISTINITICNHHNLLLSFHNLSIPMFYHTSHLLPLYIVIDSTYYCYHNCIVLSLLTCPVIIVKTYQCYHNITYMNNNRDSLLYYSNGNAW